MAHGTHVAGIVLGNTCGIAHGALLYFQSLRSDTDCLGGLPKRLSKLFDKAFRNGARIHNNSWGSESISPYAMSSSELDSFVYKHPDMLIVTAAGNSGYSKSSDFPGAFNLSSIAHPGTSKNSLTVGASETLPPVRLWPQSSRGPTKDNNRRIKPDILAPGTDIAGPKSSASTGISKSAFTQSGSNYIRMSGTSQGAAVVSGCAAIIREYYSQTRYHNASAALLKATIINGTNFLGLDVVDASPEVYQDPPNYHQGFGNICLKQSIPNSPEPSMQLEFVDTLHHNNLRLEKKGERIELDREVTNHTAARICTTGKISDDAKVHVMGHPSGLPLNVADDSFIKNNMKDSYFVANLDTYGGSPGSPIFNSDTHEVEGILACAPYEPNGHLPHPFFQCSGYSSHV